MADLNESLMAHVLKLAADRIKARVELTAEQEAVAHWLRGERDKLDSLIDLLRARMEARGALPVPSTPTEAHLDRARDAECRAVISLLRLLERAPLSGPFAIPGSEE